MVVDGHLLSVAFSFAERLTLGKDLLAECLSMPSVLLSVNVVVAESRTIPSARQKALGKASGTRQRAVFR
jgi:BarA-like signal transduction histidine kinase